MVFITRLPCFTVKSLSSTTFVLQSEYKINCSNWPLFEYKKIVLLESAKYTLLDTSRHLMNEKQKVPHYWNSSNIKPSLV